jgi:hypothetical protein
VVAGGPEEVAGRLAELAGGGFSFLNLAPLGDAAAQRERLANEVLPLLRKRLEA